MKISKRSARTSASERAVLITGGRGFIGRALAACLRAGGEKNVAQADLAAGAGVHCDFLDKAAVLRLVARLRPRRIYHLIGMFSGGYDENYKVNFLAAKNILDAVREQVPDCRVLLTGSAAEYGFPAKNPVKETDPLLPVTPYGFTKMLQTRLGEFYARAYGLDVVVARVFNLTGPGVTEALFPGRVNGQIEAYKRGATDRIKVGRLDSFRDYLTVSEAAAALRLVMDRGEPGGIYNVGSGRPVRMKALLARLLAEAGVPYSAVDSAPPPAGKPDVDKIYADISRLKRLRRAAARAAKKIS
ncbi:MAG: NAD-dependent epimerase/dehydratase family protein [Elusimicrobia bacterium]|nr:NAD-dependent epimerase/dehydratase family protein [Elusimicrobiota bacterium]